VTCRYWAMTACTCRTGVSIILFGITTVTAIAIVVFTLGKYIPARQVLGQTVVVANNSITTTAVDVQLAIVRVSAVYEAAIRAL